MSLQSFPLPLKSPETWRSEESAHDLEAIPNVSLGNFRATAKGFLLLAAFALEGLRTACFTAAKKIFPNPTYWQVTFLSHFKLLWRQVLIFLSVERQWEKGNPPFLIPPVYIQLIYNSHPIWELFWVIRVTVLRYACWIRCFSLRKANEVLRVGVHWVPYFHVLKLNFVRALWGVSFSGPSYTNQTPKRRISTQMNNLSVCTGKRTFTQVCCVYTTSPM